MLPARYYQLIYLIIVLILTLACMRKYKFYSQSRLNGNENQSYIPVIVSALLFSLFIGFRPVDVQYFVDMFNYDLHWYSRADPNYQWTWDTDNFIFDNLFGYFSGRGLSSRFLFISIAILYFVGIAFACCSIFPKDKFSTFIVYLAAFSTFSYSTNGIKAGAAASLFLIAVAFYLNRKWLGALLFLILSLGFHHSMILPVTAFIICVFVKNPKLFFYFWFFCLLMALFHIKLFQQIFAGFVDEQGAFYLLGDEEKVRHDILGGFRIDFVFYSAIPIIIGWIAVFKKKIVSKGYSFILCLYTLTNSVWMLCMYAEFTNRIAYLSWLLYPIVLIYPFLKERWSTKQYKVFQTVALGHLAFTLFMSFVYYA